MMDFQAARWTIDGEVPGQEGNHHPTMVPMGCFRHGRRLRQHRRALGRLLRNFCELLGAPRARRRPALRRLRGQRHRRNRAELNAIIAERAATAHDRRVGGARWPRSACRAGRCYAIDEVFADPQVQHLQLTAPRARTRARRHRRRCATRCTISDTPATVRSGPPADGRAHRRGAGRARLLRRRDRRPARLRCGR